MDGSAINFFSESDIVMPERTKSWYIIVGANIYMIQVQTNWSTQANNGQSLKLKTNTGNN